MLTRLPRLTAALAVLVTGASLTACGGGGGGTTSSGAQLVTAGQLTVCSDVPYAPFEDFDTSAPSGFKGFDIDIVQNIADQLGVKLAVKDSDFNALQSGLALNSNQCDIAASAMTITPDREKALAFSDPYYDSEQSLLVPKGSSITGIGDLSGKKVGVQKGTTGATYAQQNATGADIVTFPSDAEMFQAIKAGQVDALLQDLPVNLAHTTTGDFTVIEKYQTDEQYGLAMKKTNTALVTQVDDALKKMKDDGDYQKYYDQYFSTK